jgi:hypothetical protein
MPTAFEFVRYWGNSGHPATAEIDAGISEDNLATILSIALGVLAVTTGIITSYLFVAPKEA